MSLPSRRDEVARYAAPVAFLVAITILVLLVRSGLNSGGSGGSAPRVPVSTAAATTSASTTTPASKPPPKPKKQFYTVAAGDTFGVIATKFGTSVEALQALNPGVSSNSLTIGQKLRVK